MGEWYDRGSGMFLVPGECVLTGAGDRSPNASDVDDHLSEGVRAFPESHGGHGIGDQHGTRRMGVVSNFCSRRVAVQAVSDNAVTRP